MPLKLWQRKGTSNKWNSASEKRSLRAALLDIDGTLIDSNDAHAHSWQTALEEGGHPVPCEAIRRSIGKGSDQMLPDLIGVEKESEEGTKLSNRCAEVFKERYLADIKPFPQVRALLEALKGRGLLLVVATSATREQTANFLKLAEIDDLVDEQVTIDEVEQSRPQPDILMVALQKIGVSPEEAVMLGDTPYDLKAAQRAHLAGTIALRSGGWETADFPEALAVYADPADLLKQLDESPLGVTAVGG